MNKIIKLIEETVLDIGGNCYIVGGYIRDIILGMKEELLDIDIVYDGDIYLFINKLRDRGINFYVLNEKAQIFRGNIKNINIDIASMNGKNIEEDLSKRDFTINSIALDILENKIIDPFDGIEDIKSGEIKETSNLSIKNDRVRILRAIRFSIIYDFKIVPYTKEHIKNEANFLMESPKERIFEEFMKIIHYDTYGKAFETLDKCGVLKYLIPGVNNLKTIGKCRYHAVDAFTHMNTSYILFKKVQSSDILLKNVDINEVIKKDLGNFQIGDFLAFATFTHDIGKYKCYKKEGDKISFIEHDKVGAEIIRDICKELHFPNKGIKIVGSVVEAHMYPLFLFKNNLNNYKKSFYKFFSNYEDYVPYILLVSFCDVYATRLYKDDDNEKEKYKVFIEKMFYEYEIYTKIRCNRLLDGKEIMNLSGSKGKELGIMLEKIDELRYLNKLKNKEDIIKYIVKGRFL